MTHEPDDTTSGEASPPRWLTKRSILTWLLVGLVLWGIAVAFTLWEVRRDLTAAKNEADLVADQGEEIDGDALRRSLVTIDEHVQRASARSSRPILAPIRWVPFVGAQLRSVQALATTAANITGPANNILAIADGDDALSLESAPATLELIDAELAKIEQSLQDADLGPEDGLVGTLAEARADVDGELGDALVAATDARNIIHGLRSMLSGSRYLVLGANNAEMRLGAGMALSVGELTVTNGELDLPGLHPADLLFPVPETSVVDEDVDARWGFLAPSNDYRKLTYTARFADYVGPQALAMWEAQTGRRLDGVVLLDPFLFDALLSVVGPVEVGGVEIGPGEAVEYLLKGQYETFDSATETGVRRQVLSELATAVVDKMLATSWDPIVLLRKLGPLIRGRHVLAFGTDPVEQQAWQALEMSGHLTGEETGVYILNQGASKLDPFLDVAVDVTSRVEGDTRTIRYQVSIENTITDASGLADYAIGPWESIGLPSAGTYRGRIAVYAPGVSSGLRFVPERPLEVLGHDGPVTVAASQFELQPGESVEIVSEFDLPAEPTEFTVEPSARFPATSWTYGDFATTDIERFSLAIS